MKGSTRRCSITISERHSSRRNAPEILLSIRESAGRIDMAEARMERMCPHGKRIR